ncbi:hypothetical protein JP75_07905 [Devosia riboflavina]|uniref:Uncharacterized protein n=1 Tax=Devosia riboflavina TaxID=46914 RepID=A0A087M3L0_9HYPH|nr:hypothetical protein [Devosia riboflavina]KFL31463.1 hypothetical protein JP75_07905 [Devosia riboflavina]
MYLDFDMSVWSWPQWTFMSIYVISVVMAAFLHGHRRTGEHSFPVSITMSALGIFVLTAGGFFGG